MKYNIVYKIADLRSSLGKEARMQRYPDYEYTDENLEKIFEEYSKHINEKNQAKFEYLRSSMPCLEEMKSIVQDILEFYEKNFKVYTSEQEHEIKLRFFVHVKFRDEEGDADERIIRIGCKNFVKSGEDKVSFKDFIDGILYEKKEYFMNGLRKILAHELYHSLHMRHCSTINKEHGSNIYERILDEIFANYFAYEYLDDFLKRTEGEDVDNFNRKQGDAFSGWYWSGYTKYFGVGRKKLFPETYSEAEIEKDNQEFQRLMDDKKLFLEVNRDQYPVSNVEYYVGYKLASYGKKYEGGKIGKEMKLYFDLYQQYLDGNAKDALLKLTTMEEMKK